MKEKPICQSCGMPLFDESLRAINEDGSKNAEYCKYCYADGEFKDAELSLEQKIMKNIEVAVAMGIPREKAEEMAHRIIPTLKRWKK